MNGSIGEQVVETADFVMFWKPPAVLGQWTPSPFEVDGTDYNCTEQYMMAEKARLFGDMQIRSRILKSDSPRAHKQLGRKVRNFDENIWKAKRFDIVVAGNMAKFSQNPEMRAVLLATGNKTLVEASPLDRIWGIGLSANDARAFHPPHWRGENLLGKALMAVRDRLRAP